MLTQNDFIVKIKKELGSTNLTKDNIKDVLEAAATVLIDHFNDTKSTNDDCKVNTRARIPGFGTAYLTYSAGRKGVNPRNPGEELVIDPFYRVSFSVPQSMKDALNGKGTPVKKAPKKDKEEKKGKAAPKPAKKKAPSSAKRVVIDDDDDE